jgi:hypothetical protein
MYEHFLRRLCLGCASAAAQCYSACAAVLLACRLNADAVFLCACGAPQAAALSAAPAATVPSAVSAAPSPASGPPGQPCQQGTGCSFCHVLAGLHDLDVCGSNALSAHTLARLLSSCSSLRRLGVAGCTTLGAQEGASCLEAGLLSIAQLQHTQRLHQEQQQQQGLADLSAGSAASCSSSGSLTLDPEPLRTARTTTSSSSWHPPVCTVGGGLQRLCVGWGWSAAAISCVLRGSPFLISFTAGAGPA